MNALLQPATTLRTMRASDLDAVLAIEAGAYSFPWTRGNFIDSLAAGYHAELLQTADGGTVGYVVAMPGVNELHLLNITVAPAWQGRGLAQQMLDALQAHGRSHAMATLWLEVRQSNERALALYRRRGFAEVGRRRGYYPAAHGRREDAIVMKLALLPEDGDGLV
ncbi:MAG: ribosomal protein S18-alanine N-acetyltransferase [Rubrivivax sp.]